MDRWTIVEDLSMQGMIKEVWDAFIHRLYAAGIFLSNQEDKLVWTWNLMDGQVNVKDAYEALMFKAVQVNIDWWKNSIWSWNLPLKIRLFNWLLLNNSILTWDNLCCRGFCGPGFCILCNQAEESVSHLMCNCAFIQAVWEKICVLANDNFVWAFNNPLDCFFHWSRSRRNYLELPCYVVWEIWKSRNRLVF
jgi:hypothetical protein